MQLSYIIFESNTHPKHCHLCLLFVFGSSHGLSGSEPEPATIVRSQAIWSQSHNSSLALLIYGLAHVTSGLELWQHYFKVVSPNEKCLGCSWLQLVCLEYLRGNLLSPANLCANYFKILPSPKLANYSCFCTTSISLPFALTSTLFTLLSLPSFPAAVLCMYILISELSPAQHIQKLYSN